MIRSCSLRALGKKNRSLADRSGRGGTVDRGWPDRHLLCRIE